MGLANALVDRARCVRQLRTGRKVEGQPVIKPEFTTWFRCRLEPADTASRADDGHWERTAHTWLICGVKDIEFRPVKVLATDYIQILSDDVDVGEDAVWQINGDVTPMRRRRGVIGFEFKVTQIREMPTWLNPTLLR